MPSLLCIRHSQPTIDPTMDARDWRLSPAGRSRCKVLATEIATCGCQRLVASDEPKAMETARLLAEQLDIPWETAADLHEHDRRDEGFSDRQQFVERIQTFFAQPDCLIYGRETANQATARICRAIQQVRESCRGEQIGIVTHGTVMTLYVAHFQPAIDRFQLWQHLGLPCVLQLTQPDQQIISQWHWEER